MYETYLLIGKTIGDHIHDFKIINNHMTKSKSGVSCKFLIHVFYSSKRNIR